MTKNKMEQEAFDLNESYKQSLRNKAERNPMAKEVRTPKYKSQVIKSKKIYDRKKKEINETQ